MNLAVFRLNFHAPPEGLAGRELHFFRQLEGECVVGPVRDLELFGVDPVAVAVGAEVGCKGEHRIFRGDVFRSGVAGEQALRRAKRADVQRARQLAIRQRPFKCGLCANAAGSATTARADQLDEAILRSEAPRQPAN